MDLLAAIMGTSGKDRARRTCATETTNHIMKAIIFTDLKRDLSRRTDLGEQIAAGGGSSESRDDYRNILASYENTGLPPSLAKTSRAPSAATPSFRVEKKRARRKRGIKKGGSKEGSRKKEKKRTILDLPPEIHATILRHLTSASKAAQDLAEACIDVKSAALAIPNVAIAFTLEDEVGWAVWDQETRSFCYDRYKGWPISLGWFQNAGGRPLRVYESDIEFCRSASKETLAHQLS